MYVLLSLGKRGYGTTEYFVDSFLGDFLLCVYAYMPAAAGTHVVLLEPRAHVLQVPSMPAHLAPRGRAPDGRVADRADVAAHHLRVLLGHLLRKELRKRLPVLYERRGQVGPARLHGLCDLHRKLHPLQQLC